MAGGNWKSKETALVAEMLEKDRDHRDDILDRYLGRDILDEAVFRETVGDIAFALEDDVRADMRYHYIDASMWGHIVLPVIDGADFREIADVWLSRIRDKRRERKETSEA